MPSRFAIAKSHVVDAIDDIVPELFGGAKSQTRRYRNRWAVLNRWRPGAHLDQMTVWRDGARRGAWHDFGGGDKGDAIDLVAYGLTGAKSDTARMRALEWIENRFGLKQMTAEQRRELEAIAAKRRAEVEQQAAADLKASRDKARKSFYAARAGLEDTPAEIYLRGRGIALGDVPNISEAFRYRAECQYWMARSSALRSGEDANRFREPPPTFPAILSAMVDAEGKLGAIHYTFLEPDGSAKLRTGDRGYLDDEGRPLSAKLMYPGGVAGLFIPVTYGPSGKRPNAPDAPAGIVGWTEGIEDSFSAAIATPDLRMHAAGSLPGLAAAPDLHCASAHLVFRDNDWTKPAAVKLFDQALARFRTFGKPVRALAMDPAWGKDLNDALNSS